MSEKTYGCFHCRGKGQSQEPPDWDKLVVCPVCEGTGKAGNLESRGLPKWPAMRVSGMPITVWAAKEIIRRTDSFFMMMSGGNDRNFTALAARAVKMPITDDRVYAIEKEKGFDAYIKEIHKIHKAQDEWREKWGVISLQYCDNDWVASAFINGPHGWCRPDGSIEYHYNVGKWPKVTELLEEWRVLAKEFPFLDLGITLMDREHCEEGAQPVVSIVVTKGDVILCEPDEEKVHGRHPKVHVPEPPAENILIQGNENGLPWDWFVEWAEVAEKLIK